MTTTGEYQRGKQRGFIGLFHEVLSGWLTETIGCWQFSGFSLRLSAQRVCQLSILPVSVWVATRLLAR
jgi:hypothetical protein